MVNFPSISKVVPQPYGVTLIMSPWNYPFQLALIPLVWSLAAGNCVILKPSEYSASTSSVVKDIVEDTFQKNMLQLFKEVKKKVKSYYWKDLIIYFYRKY